MNLKTNITTVNQQKYVNYLTNISMFFIKIIESITALTFINLALFVFLLMYKNDSFIYLASFFDNICNNWYSLGKRSGGNVNSGNKKIHITTNKMPFL